MRACSMCGNKQVVDLGATGGYRQGSTLWHRIAGIGRKVHQHLFKTNAVGKHHQFFIG